jgi:GWxTD domain-containing protein
MRTRVVVLSMVLAVWAAVAAAQLSPKYSGWAAGPEGFLLTKKELKEWGAIKTDEAAEHFIDLFWARRDPNLQSPVNEFRTEFDRRVKHADDTFASEGHRGAMTDRGRVLIVMGAPDKSEKRAPTETVVKMDDRDTGTDEVRANSELWMYDPARLPAALKLKGTRVLFVFYEPKAETNEFVLDRSHPEATHALRALGAMPDVYLLHPDLTEPPKPVVVYGAKAADEAHLAWLQATAPPWSGKSQLLLEPGVADASFRPLWAELVLPADAPLLEELAGRVTSPDGKVTGTFQVAAKPLAAGAFKVYHLTFPLTAGTYRVEIAGAVGGQAQVVVAGDAQLDAIPAAGTWMSPIWIGLTAEREESAPLGAAYSFGGWHLVPLVDGTASKKDELSYFGFLAHPGLTAEGATDVTAKVLLKRGDKRLGQPFTTPLPTKELTPGLFIYANSLTLSGLRDAGEYAFEFTVKDGVSGTEVQRTLAINLNE